MGEIIKHVFTSIFAVEMVLKVLVYRLRYVHDIWNLLDFAIAWISILNVSGELDNWHRIRTSLVNAKEQGCHQ